ncbi:MAG: acetyl esterase/lipase [Cryomorphaceae bacterium]|jgi:acetyl esterase/lipase
MSKQGYYSWLAGIVLGFIFTGEATHGAEPLSLDQMEAGEVALSKSVPGKHPFFHIWPRDGKRADDPLKDLKEVFGNRIKNVTRPSIMVMKPEKPNGKAIIVFPGGGYGHLAARKEGSLVGDWLIKQGITAFVVKYRVPKRKGVNAPLQDAQRAIRFIRGNAKRFGINPKMVGVMGFSAGGHLCATSIHQFDTTSYPPIDDLDKLDCKPDFGILIYPAYLGKNGTVSEELREVKDTSIPIYVAISKNDPYLIGVEAYIPILRRARVSYEYHVYATGKHGTGLGGFPWINTCEDWIRSQIRPKTEQKDKLDNK